MRECAAVSNSTYPDFFASRNPYARMRANIFTCPWEGLGLGPLCANAQLSRTAHIQIFVPLKPLRANARQYFHMAFGWVRVGTTMRECAAVSNSTYPDFFASRNPYARMRANIFTCPWDRLGLGPLCANAQLSRTAHIQIFLPVGTPTRECAPKFSHALAMG